MSRLLKSGTDTVGLTSITSGLVPTVITFLEADKKTEESVGLHPPLAWLFGRLLVQKPVNLRGKLGRGMTTALADYVNPLSGKFNRSSKPPTQKHHSAPAH
jgi:hypothetical protein